MEKDNSVLHIFFLVLLLLGPAYLAAAQHEGHDPGGSARTSDDRQPGGKGHEANCQRVARLAAELDEEFEALVDVSDPAELRSHLSRHKVKLQELRAATGTCSPQCAKRTKRKGCGHSMMHP